ncbi:HAAS signaling domain-containing protein [Shouchella patagoniensis]|uniref:HAAS signaling domain-containing protein n=1 Tax=Shouchella patagoniensis TaxID=228576 RepID=UPI000995DB1D|nr:hypothetical protein [Shouchella patagoniensis]
MTSHYTSVEAYVKQLEDQLSRKLPKSERKSQLLEIENHLESSISEREHLTESRREAVQAVLSEFISPVELAKQINSENTAIQETTFETDDIGFKAGTGFLFTGFGLLAVSVFYGELKWELLMVGTLSIIGVLLVLSLSSIKWNGERIDFLKSIGKQIQFIVVPIGGAAFIIRSLIDGTVNYRAFLYMIGYLLVALCVFLFLKKLYHLKNVYR